MEKDGETANIIAEIDIFFIIFFIIIMKKININPKKL